MTFLPFLHFFALVTFLYLIVYILYKDPKGLYNRALAVYVLSFMIWSFGKIFVHSPSSSRETANLLENIASFGWISFASFFIWTILIFTGKTKLAKSKLMYFLAVPPIMFFYLQWKGLLLSDHTRQPYGWANVWSDSVWPHLFFAYYGLFMLAGLILLFGFLKNIKGVKKNQAVVLFFTTLSILFAGTMADVILPLRGVHIIPELADVFLLFWAAGLAYAVARYKFLTITPGLASDNIISTMADALFLLGREGSIVFANPSAARLLGYDKRYVEGRNAEFIFSEKERKSYWFDRMLIGEDIKSREISLRTKTGREIPVIFSSTTLRDDAGDVIGKVCIASDITELEKAREAAMKEKEFSDKVINGLPGIFYVFDDQGHFLRWNGNLEKIGGYTADEIKKMHPLDFFREEEKETVADAIRKVMEEGSASVEADLLTKRGRLIPYFFSGITAKIGNTACLIGLGADITDRKTSDEELRRKVNQLEHFKKLTVGRELEMVKLKEKLNELLKELGKPGEY